MDWSVALTAFGGALVEFVEAAIIAVAAANAGGWRPALSGVVAALAILVVAVGALGTTVLHFVPLVALRWGVGALLLLFGVKWLAKATLRLGGTAPGGHAPSEDLVPPHAAMLTAFNGTLLEGAEVAFIVLALGTTGGALGSALAGAAVAGGLCALGSALARRPLAAVPDVTLKFIVGVMLCSFGTFWLGEALGIPWWGADASLLWIAAGNLALALLAIWIQRRRHPAATAERPKGATA